MGFRHERLAGPTAGWPTPLGGWPSWVWDAPYDGTRHPQSRPFSPVSAGANCQRYAYSILALFDLCAPPLRSSELWSAIELEPVTSDSIRPLDLVLFNSSQNPYGAHVGVAMPQDEILHLCKEIGRPAIWPLSSFERRERYKTFLGGRRVTVRPEYA